MRATFSSMTIAPRTRALAFLALWLTLGITIFFGSYETLRHVEQGALDHASHFHLALLGSVEALGAVLFLIPRTVRIGGSILLVVFLAGLVMHALGGEVRIDLLQYAAATFFVMVYEPVPWGTIFDKGPTGA